MVQAWRTIGRVTAGQPQLEVLIRRVRAAASGPGALFPCSKTGAGRMVEIAAYLLPVNKAVEARSRGDSGR